MARECRSMLQKWKGWVAQVKVESSYNELDAIQRTSGANRRGRTLVVVASECLTIRVQKSVNSCNVW
jgi:hypothetical protein